MVRRHALKRSDGMRWLTSQTPGEKHATAVSSLVAGVLPACLPGEDTPMPNKSRESLGPVSIAFARFSMAVFRKRDLTLVVGIMVVSWGWSVPANAKPTYTTFDPPGSTNTIATCISNSVIAGYYGDNNGGHGFVRAADGTITTFDAFGTHGTQVSSIDARGTIAGYYSDDNGILHAFVRATNGTITTFDPQGSGGTVATSINKGTITGYYGDSNGLVHGFARAAGGTITTFDPSGSNYTYPTGINPAGGIAGYYKDSFFDPTHGFVRAIDGTFTTFDPSGSISTYTTGINKDGVIAGDYQDGNSVYHGFARAADGTITTFDPAGSIQTYALSIDNRGAITGYYLDNGGYQHGFVRQHGGRIKAFDPPGSNLTNPFGIDSGKDSGAIAGFYQDTQFHGFLRTP